MRSSQCNLKKIQLLAKVQTIPVISSTDTVALSPINGLINMLITRRIVCEVSKLFFARQSCERTFLKLRA